MCRDVTLQAYNMAKQLQPPPVDYLLYMRESRCIQSFVIAAVPVSDDESGYGRLPDAEGPPDAAGHRNVAQCHGALNPKLITARESCLSYILRILQCCTSLAG